MRPMPLTARTTLLALALLAAACSGARPAPPGTRVLTGAPAGGLAYRLLLPVRAGDAAPPLRLLVWMHPQGASENARIEALAPHFAAAGYALLVPVEKDVAQWRGWELNRLLGVTVPALAGTPGLEVRRPVLLGWSAGGQMALLTWAAAPGALGGVVALGTAPVDAAGAPLAPAQVRPDTPLLVVTGARDVGAGPWEAHAPRLRQQGAAVEVLTVPDRGHVWLLEGDVTARVAAWLTRLHPRPAP